MDSYSLRHRLLLCRVLSIGRHKGAVEVVHVRQSDKPRQEALAGTKQRFVPWPSQHQRFL